MDDKTRIGRRELIGAGLAVGTAVALPTAALSRPTRAIAKPHLPPLIDVHAHAIPRAWYDWLAKKSAPDAPRMEGGIAVPQWTPQMALDLMDTHGVQAQILSHSIGTKGMTPEEAVPLARRINSELADIIARHPTRFGAYACLPLQDIDAALRETRYALDTLGFDGVCIQTSFDGRYPGDPYFRPLFEELDRRRAVAFVHPHAPLNAEKVNIPVIPGMIEFVFDSTRALVSLVCSGTRRRFPNFTYIATHGGGTLPFVADRVAYVTGLGTGFPAKLTYEEAMADLKSIHYDLAITAHRPALLALRDFVGSEKIMYGSDYPFVAVRTLAPGIQTIANSGVFNRAELAAVARNNALRLFPNIARRLSKPLN